MRKPMEGFLKVPWFKGIVMVGESVEFPARSQYNRKTAFR